MWWPLHLSELGCCCSWSLNVVQSSFVPFPIKLVSSFTLFLCLKSLVHSSYVTEAAGVRKNGMRNAWEQQKAQYIQKFLVWQLPFRNFFCFIINDELSILSYFFSQNILRITFCLFFRFETCKKNITFVYGTWVEGRVTIHHWSLELCYQKLKSQVKHACN